MSKMLCAHHRSGACLQCRYVPEYLAVGEAPDQVRNCFQQRSRWCKVRLQIIIHLGVCSSGCIGSAECDCSGTSGHLHARMYLLTLLAFALLLQGHFQVVFSRQHCPFLQRRLSLFMKVYELFII